MKLRVKIELLKFCSAVFNSVFLALGLSVAGCGIWILFGDSSFLSLLPSDELRVVAVTLLAMGGAVAALSAAGCVGAGLEKRSLLLVDMASLAVLVLAQLFVVLLLLINRHKMERGLDAAVDAILVRYGDGEDGAEDALIDTMQRYGACCGVEGPADWLKNSYIKSLNLSGVDQLDLLPCSCFRGRRPAVADGSPWCSMPPGAAGPGNDTFQQGCKTSLSDWLQENSLTIAGMAVGLILVQALQFVVALFLHRSFGLKVAPQGSDALVDRPAPDGERNHAFVESDDDDDVDQDAYFVDRHHPHPPHPPAQRYQDDEELPRDV
ncbi:unnamed protein product [Ophioblennius macclurei]